ncbi:MAG TPA: methyltransferase domain-containing protein [Candidatus Udaeobacter sp.]|jgi:2-polyprenyl-3-methyl-5-hydroxy-6-metoxy-1,4-benzoquinol methylase|nr:methyltransferase domain-containing protein [Candidatus Udaeobacter sp.]
MSLLDVACGPGYVSAAAKQLGALVTETDFSESMIALEKGIKQFARGNEFVLPMAANVIVVSKG